MRLRIPHGLIDAVRNAVETIAQPVIHAVQPEAATRRAQFARVCRAHRDHLVGECESAFQEVEAIIPLELLIVVQLGRNAALLHHGRGEVPLVSTVVHRQDRWRCSILCTQLGIAVHVDQCQGCVPIVRVNQDRAMNQPGNSVEH